jgi:hypothetical protein
LSAGRDRADSLHIESHATLLQRPALPAVADPEPPRALDAIVVPTIRPHYLGPAVGLAREVGCALVVLCTTPGQAGRARQECTALAGESLVTYVAQSADADVLNFLSSQHPETDIEPSCHTDIARKRNVGLLLAHLCGWRTVMFLDDDIRGVSAAAVSWAASLTAHFQAAGFEISHYPDNSVVCHAHRLSGGNQDVFPAGSALLVDVQRSDTLFPPVYNEDWLFLFDAAQRRSVALAGVLAQLEYQPFAQPRRAASEEFGDVIAEGLFRLLHEGASLAGATHAYWQSVLERRSRLIDQIADELLRCEPAPPLTGSALMSLAAARKRLASITELSCLSFVRAWRTDVDGWRQRLGGLPVLADLAGAANYLDLPNPDGGVNQ